MHSKSLTAAVVRVFEKEGDEEMGGFGWLLGWLVGILEGWGFGGLAGG